MKTTKLAEFAARNNMTARQLERLLERVGWMKDGVILDVLPYLAGGELSPRGCGYLAEASRG
jgi:hypothetical protein